MQLFPPGHFLLKDTSFRLRSKSAEPLVSESAQWPYTHNTWLQSGNGLAKNACETRALHQEPSASSCHSKQSRPGNKGVLPLSPASRDSFPALPLLVSYECTRNNSRGYHTANVHHHRGSKKESTCVCSRPRSQMNVFLATHPVLNQSCSIANLGHAGTLVCTIPGWACTIRNGREHYLFRSYDQWHFFVCRQEPSKTSVCKC